MKSHVIVQPLPIHCLLALFVALTPLTPLTVRSQSASPIVLDQGHVTIEIVHEDGDWSFFLDAGHAGPDAIPPEDVVCHLTEAARLVIPDSPTYSFLGDPGDPVWIAPHMDTPGLLTLGVSGERIAPGLFVNNRLDLRLVDVDGPGDFAVYRVGSAGQVTLYFSTHDGITDQDILPVALASHDHQNWAFNAPGHYRVTFRASATLAANSEWIESPDVTCYFAVGDVDPTAFPHSGPVLLDEGDTDIAVVLEDGELVLEIFSEPLDRSFPHDGAIFIVSPATRIEVPDNPAFAFLGSPGATVWVLPQQEEEDKLFLAMAAEDIPTGHFQDDLIRVTLKEFAGPGRFFLYQTDAFGVPRIFIDTRDGVSDEDHRDLMAGDHYHMNWAFTAPGVYTLGFQASGALAASGTVQSTAITPFTFHVIDDQPPAISITRVDPDSITLVWLSDPTASYQVRSRPSLVEGDWQDEGPVLTGTGSILTFQIPIARHVSSLFVRVEHQAGEE
jgi:surface-anchored protein